MTPADRKTLLAVARQAILARLSDRPLPAVPALEQEPAEFGGVFVTLRSGARLRGCIGRFNPEGGLPGTVQEMALAALADPRFRNIPVTATDLPGLHIEISVLSSMTPTHEPLSLEPGVHGIYIRRGMHGGCFLPQVATEQGWDTRTFLSRCCRDKAGLPPDAWLDPATEVFCFTSEVFEEHA